MRQNWPVFWFYEWLDERGISSLEEAERRLRDPKELSLLHERAAREPYETSPIPPSDKVSLLAGRGVDLSGDLDCLAWSCRRRQVDTLLSRAWHYFDRVVVVGPSAHRIASDLEEDAQRAAPRVLDDIQLLLYLREVGADQLLAFRQKPPPCEVHVPQHAQEAGLALALGRLEELASRLAPEAAISTDAHDDHVHYSFAHPRFEHTVWGAAWPESSDVRHAVTQAVLRRYMSHLTSDIRASRSLALPLASTVQIHGDLLGLTPDAPSVAEVMFNLRLPVIDGMHIQTLLSLRDTQGEYFEQFRVALRTAASERLKAGTNGATAVADAIQEEIIQPALVDIDVRLRAAADTLRRKTRLTTSLSAVLTACGVYFGEPLVATAGLAAAGASVQAVMKNLDDFHDVQLADMFFLWEAARHNHKR
jgi:hypothetical protein